MTMRYARQRRRKNSTSTYRRTVGLLNSTKTNFRRRQTRCVRLRNDLYCVGRGVKLYSLTQTRCEIVRSALTSSVSAQVLTVSRVIVCGLH